MKARFMRRLYYVKKKLWKYDKVGPSEVLRCNKVTSQ